MANKDMKNGVREILLKLPSECLHSLASTVTNGLLKSKIRNREEAIAAVIKYSPTLSGVLKRQKVTREILLEYAHECKIPVKLPITKPELIEAILTHWKSTRMKTVVVQRDKENDCNVQLLAEKFSEWFYSLLNSNEPVGTEHFFCDAKLVLNLINGAQKLTEQINNSAEAITDKLQSTKNTHSLYFNPNLTKDSVRGRMDRHGLVVVDVSGTLHCGSICVGVFEQVFSLARDPFAENNWKIKCTELNLRKSENVNTNNSSNKLTLTHNLLQLTNA